MLRDVVDQGICAWILGRAAYENIERADGVPVVCRVALVLGVPGTKLVQVCELARLPQPDELLGDPGDLARISLPG